jgi:hypothetical protein
VDGDEAAVRAVLLCHDGASSKGLADTIKNTIILMVLPNGFGWMSPDSKRRLSLKICC